MKSSLLVLISLISQVSAYAKGSGPIFKNATAPSSSTPPGVFSIKLKNSQSQDGKYFLSSTSFTSFVSQSAASLNPIINGISVTNSAGAFLVCTAGPGTNCSWQAKYGWMSYAPNPNNYASNSEYILVATDTYNNYYCLANTNPLNLILYPTYGTTIPCATFSSS